MSTSRSSTPRRRRRARVVALTGVHGVVGAALLRRLDEDDAVSRVVLLDRRAPDVPMRRATFVLCDLTATLADGVLADVLARERVQTLVHAAFHETPHRDREAAHELEVIGTQALLRAAAHDVRHGGSLEHLVVLGSTMSYGARADNPQYLAEDAPLRGGDGYPFVADRVAVEEAVAAFARRSGLPTALLRRCWTVGDPRTLMARWLAPPAQATVLGRDPLVQLLHLDDCVDAVRLAVQRRADGVFNVVGEGVLPLSSVVTLAGRFRVPSLESALRPGLQALWAVGLGLVPGSHVTYLRDTFVADGTLAAEAFGFRPRLATRDALHRHVLARRGGFPLAA